MKHESATRATWPYDPATMDIACGREPTGQQLLDGSEELRVACNISQRIVCHSPTGFEWGYGGSGPGDFALNILDLFLPPKGDESDLKMEVTRGPAKCSFEAWAYHDTFKRDWLCGLEAEGGSIKGFQIATWILTEREVGRVPVEERTTLVVPLGYIPPGKFVRLDASEG